MRYKPRPDNVMLHQVNFKMLQHAKGAENFVHYMVSDMSHNVE